MGEFAPVTARIVTLPGDGIGPEIMGAARELLATLGEFELDERPLGGASIDAHGTAPSADRSGTRPTRPRRAPSRGCSACARGLACSPTCGPCGRAPPCSTPAR